VIGEIAYVAHEISVIAARWLLRSNATRTRTIATPSTTLANSSHTPV